MLINFNLHLAMKLHYLKAAYIYTPEMARDLSVTHVKEAIFKLFDQIAWTTGRLWRRDSGRPYIKCNDCGARFVEGKCNFTVEEWLSKPDRSVDEFLVYHQPVGPELPFSPLIYVQVKFFCNYLCSGNLTTTILSSYSINRKKKNNVLFFSLPYSFS